MNRNFLLICVILVGVAIICNMPNKFSGQGEVQVSAFPKEIGNWRGEDIPIPERDFEILETKNLIIREYKNSVTNENVSLYIIYSGSKRRALHPPEICYTGGGATILRKSVIALNSSLKANTFLIEDKNSRQLVVYWFRSGTFNTYSYLKQQLRFVTDRLIGKKATGAMVRVSADIKGSDEGKALSVISSFLEQILPLLDKYVP